MMSPIIVHSSSMAEWQALVQEAEVSSETPLSEELESYLVFLLMRFMSTPEIINRIVAIDLLNTLQNDNSNSQQSLRDLGDICLLFSGLFPQNARRRRVNLSYYVKLGKCAYASLSYSHKKEIAELFDKLCLHFVGLMDVLQTMREIDPKATSSIDLLDAVDLWTTSKSRHALKILRKSTQGFIFPLNP
jgi:hypothetical protein